MPHLAVPLVALRLVPLLAPLLLLQTTRAPAALGGSLSALPTRDLPASLCVLAPLLSRLLQRLCVRACVSVSLGKKGLHVMPCLPWLSSSAGWPMLARTTCPAKP